MTNERTGSTENRIESDRTEAPAHSPSAGRRGLLVTGAAAAAGAAFFTNGQQARAATGDPLLLGRSNTATSGTTLQGTVSSSAFTVYQKGTGNGAFLVSDTTTGVTGKTLHPNAWAAVVQNSSSATGLGGGLRVEGRANTGLFADVNSGELEVPAVAAFGGHPDDGTALFTRGIAMMDGDVLALRNHVGIANARQELVYAPVTSGHISAHEVHGTLTLNAQGTASVTLPADFLSAIKPQTMVVTFTPVGAAMPNLYLAAAPTASSTGFQVAGGTSGGTVQYVARAERLVLGTPAATPAPPKAPIDDGERTTAAAPVRNHHRRPTLRLPKA